MTVLLLKVLEWAECRKVSCMNFMSRCLHGKKKTSDDGLFTLETVACLGACGLAPVMTVDGEVHAKMDPERAIELLESIRKEEVRA